MSREERDLAPGRLGGRIAVVTGAARGIGRAVALRLAREGAAGVVGLDVRREEGQETACLVEELGRPASTRALFLEADVTRAEEVEAAAARVREEFGRCHVLVNDAGISGRPLGDGPSTSAAWRPGSGCRPST